jgi:hypothetical protein
MAGENGKQDAPGQNEVSPGFKFRVIMTMVFFILALVYILWLIKLI